MLGGDSKLSSLPILDFTDVRNQSYLQAIMMELLPQDRDRAMTAGDPKQVPPTILTSEYEKDTTGNAWLEMENSFHSSSSKHQASRFRMYIQLRIAHGSDSTGNPHKRLAGVW